jgi:hypothetical protein
MASKEVPLLTNFLSHKCTWKFTSFGFNLIKLHKRQFKVDIAICTISQRWPLLIYKHILSLDLKVLHFQCEHLKKKWSH